ncbi:MAG: hypothetical protein AAF799_22415 [Myxococcota bacterium]
MSDSTNDPSTAKTRMITRWIGCGIGGAMLITVLSLSFAQDCVDRTEGHVLAVVLALGAALLLWGVVGGLQIDVRLKFKALGEIAAAGVAGIFLVVHFVAVDGIVGEDCHAGPTEPEVYVFNGRVHLQGDVTKSIQGAEVTFDLPDRVVKRTTDGDGQFSLAIKDGATSVRVWATKAGFENSEAKAVELPLSETKYVIEMKKAGSPTKPGPKPGSPMGTVPSAIPSDAKPMPKDRGGLRINTGAAVQPKADLDKAKESPRGSLSLLP